MGPIFFAGYKIPLNLEKKLEKTKKSKIILISVHLHEMIQEHKSESRKRHSILHDNLLAIVKYKASDLHL